MFGLRRLDGSELLLTPVNTGMATLSVIAQDQKGAKTSAPLRVTVDGTGAEVELFPNPCNERLNLRIPGATGNFRMEFRDRSGRYVYGASVAVGPEENGNTGWLNVSERRSTSILTKRSRQLLRTGCAALPAPTIACSTP